jgi:hypothetical protein
MKGNSKVTQGLFKFCVSTIIDEDRIRKFLSDGYGAFAENKAWKTARVLFLESLEIGTRMPLILSDAAHNTERLRCWGMLQQLELDGERTLIKFDNVKKIRGNRQRQELVLRSSGTRIAANFIRPYAICHTPEFLE